VAKRHLSVEKRARQNIKRNRRNRVVKSAIRGALKQAAASSDPAQIPKLATNAQRVLDRAVSKRVIPKNRAARLKSRLMKKAALAKKAGAVD